MSVVNIENNNLHHRINKYICRKGDIFNGQNYDRDAIINEIISLYKNYCSKYLNEPDEYLNYLNNDILSIIGYKYDMEKLDETEGSQLWTELDELMIDDKGIVIFDKVISLLNEVPLYFLMTLYGNSYFMTITADRL
jgi:hypothetical protein